MPASERRLWLVTTTIHVPDCLSDYLENAARHGHAENVHVVVVGDRKTPARAAEFLAGLDAGHPGRVVYLDVDDQVKWLSRWPALSTLIRWNSIQRRNVGYLFAAAKGADVIVSADDDNFVGEGDYFGPHLRAGTTQKVPVVSHPSGWWNVCERLRSEPPRRFYHRGFPKSLQTWETGGYRTAEAEVDVAVNAGLWLETPDVDATTNIEEPFDVVGMDPIAGSDTAALAPGTWCPFNSQNTAFDAKMLPALYLVVMHDRVRGYRIGRLDDIWMSYFVRAIGDRLGAHVQYGTPLVTQKRNPHDFTKDLTEELPGYRLTEWLVPVLRRFDEDVTGWSDGYRALIEHLREAAEASPDLADPEREYVRQVVLGMSVWWEAARDVRGERTDA